MKYTILILSVMFFLLSCDVVMDIIQDVTGENDPPVAAILRPAGGSVFSKNDLITFECSITDKQDLPYELSLKWENDGAFLSSEVMFTVTGIELGIGTHVIRLVVTDSEFATFVSEISIEVVGDSSGGINIEF